MSILGTCTETTWRERIGLAFLLVFLVIAVVKGIDMVRRPRQHMNGFLGQGEMLRDLQEGQVLIFGLLLIAGGCWGLYSLVTGVWTHCFG